MRIRHAWLVLVAVVLLASPAVHADNHWIDARAAASASAGSELGGIQLTITKTLGREGVPRVWNLVGDFNYQWGAHDLKQSAWFGGVRRNIMHHRFQYGVPFVQGLVGRARDHDNPPKSGRYWMAVTGLGVDLVNDRFKNGHYK